MRKLTKSLSVDVTAVNVTPKQFKVMTDAIRSAVKNEHGYKAQRGLKDQNLRSSAVLIRFYTAQDRHNFEVNLKAVLNPQITRQMRLQYLKPKSPSSQLTPVKLLAVV